MALPSRAEILNFIAAREGLEKTLERFPGVTREQLRAVLRDAAVLLLAEEQGVEEQPDEKPLAPLREQKVSPPAPAAAVPSPHRPVPEPAAETAAGEGAKRLKLYSDGAARGNPGPAGAGAVLMKQDGTLVAKLGKFLGTQTNNVAEYTALILGLETALRLGADEIDVFADSELLIRQLEGVYKVKSPGLKPLYDQVKLLLRRFQLVRLQHVPREKNKLADEMSNRAIDEKM